MLLNSACDPGIIRIYQISVLRKKRFFFLKKGDLQMMRYLGLLGSKGRRTGKEKRFGILHYEKRSGVERGIYFLPPHRWPYYIKRQILMIPKQVEHI